MLSPASERSAELLDLDVSRSPRNDRSAMDYSPLQWLDGMAELRQPSEGWQSMDKVCGITDWQSFQTQEHRLGLHTIFQCNRPSESDLASKGRDSNNPHHRKRKQRCFDSDIAKNTRSKQRQRQQREDGIETSTRAEKQQEQVITSEPIKNTEEQTFQQYLSDFQIYAQSLTAHCSDNLKDLGEKLGNFIFLEKQCRRPNSSFVFEEIIQPSYRGLLLDLEKLTFNPNLSDMLRSACQFTIQIIKSICDFILKCEDSFCFQLQKQQYELEQLEQSAQLSAENFMSQESSQHISRNNGLTPLKIQSKERDAATIDAQMNYLEFGPVQHSNLNIQTSVEQLSLTDSRPDASKEKNHQQTRKWWTCEEQIQILALVRESLPRCPSPHRIAALSQETNRSFYSVQSKVQKERKKLIQESLASQSFDHQTDLDQQERMLEYGAVSEQQRMHEQSVVSG